MNIGLKYVTDANGERVVTIPDDKRAMVIAFVRDGAAKTPAEIASIVREGHDELCSALGDVSEEQARFKPSADAWSVLELMAHVVTTKQAVAGLARSLAGGQWPPGLTEEWQEPRRQDGVTFRTFETLSEACAASEAAYGDLIDCIDGLDGPIDLEKRFRHFLFGDLNAREWAVFQRVHDADHTPQIESIKASAGYPAE